ncbi:hypothetical protein SAMN05660413_03205 [Salegentibacter flavus]|uniref:Uncharacterized protein n=1 Tax=Salegentibacter flavus TaxID=287099 RepID=A0A1I5D6Y9_9FLAO|nr:hypothetical protein SAMN05660413_03205 [Salegentibacter flavus]
MFYKIWVVLIFLTHPLICELYIIKDDYSKPINLIYLSQIHTKLHHDCS